MGPLVQAENRALLAAVQRTYDIIWIEKGIFLRAATIRALKERCGMLTHFTPDPAFHSHTRTRHFLNTLPLYDVCGTTKPTDLALYERFGARRVVLLPKSYNPALHHPYPPEELGHFRSDIVFAGTWTPFKAAAIRKVVDGLPEAKIQIWGGEWRRKCRDEHLLKRHRGPDWGILGADYGRVLAGAKIGLGLLATDTYPDERITDRILEIPACGSLLVAPRTPEIASLFLDGEEALLFDSDAELLEQLAWALTHETDRRAIAERGRARVLAGPYRDQDVVERLLGEALTLARKERP
jgi:spore maturation protein CgeB